jgi:hypothetical protein
MMTGLQNDGSLTGHRDDLGQDLHARIAHLEDWVCTLLIKNQILRMGLQPELTPRPCNSVFDSRPGAEGSATHKQHSREF